MQRDARYQLLTLLHEYVTEQRTACLDARDIAVDLVSTIGPDEFSTPLVERAEQFLAEITKLGPGSGEYTVERVQVGSAGHLTRFKVLDREGNYIPGGLFSSEAAALNFILDHDKAHN